MMQGLHQSFLYVLLRPLFQFLASLRKYIPQMVVS
jgi:hypothetical protein